MLGGRSGQGKAEPLRQIMETEETASKSQSWLLKQSLGCS